MTRLQQRRYEYLRNIWLSPLGGLLYFIIPPALPGCAPASAWCGM